MHTVTKTRKIGRIAIWCIAGTLVAAIAGMAAIPILLLPDMILLHADVEERTAQEFGIAANEVTLLTSDQLALVAWEVPVDQPKGVVMLLSGIHNPSVTEFFGYAKFLQEQGFASLLIEQRAHGRSEGDRIGLGMEEYRDVAAGIDYLQDAGYADLPMLVWGTSMGGTTALVAAAKLPELDGVISASAFSSWSAVFADQMTLMGAPQWFSQLTVPFVDLYLAVIYGWDAMQNKPVRLVSQVKQLPLLLMHSTEDSQVPFANYERLRSKLQNADSLQTLIRHGDAHFIINEEAAADLHQDPEFVQAVIQFLAQFDAP